MFVQQMIDQVFAVPVEQDVYGTCKSKIAKLYGKYQCESVDTIFKQYIADTDVYFI